MSHEHFGLTPMCDICFELAILRAEKAETEISAERKKRWEDNSKIQRLEQENAHLRKVNGIKLRQRTVKQSLIFSNEALEARKLEADKFRDLAARNQNESEDLRRERDEAIGLIQAMSKAFSDGLAATRHGRTWEELSKPYRDAESFLTRHAPAKNGENNG